MEVYKITNKYEADMIDTFIDHITGIMDIVEFPELYKLRRYLILLVQEYDLDILLDKIE